MEKFGFYQPTQLSISDIIQYLAGAINKRSNIKVKDYEQQTESIQIKPAIGSDIAIGDDKPEHKHDIKEIVQIANEQMQGGVDVQSDKEEQKQFEAEEEKREHNMAGDFGSHMEEIFEKSEDINDLSFEETNYTDISQMTSNEDLVEQWVDSLKLKSEEERKYMHASLLKFGDFSKSGKTYKQYINETFPKDKTFNYKKSKDNGTSSDDAISDFWYEFKRGNFKYLNKLPLSVMENEPYNVLHDKQKIIES